MRDARDHLDAQCGFGDRTGHHRSGFYRPHDGQRCRAQEPGTRYRRIPRANPQHRVRMPLLGPCALRRDRYRSFHHGQGFDGPEEGRSSRGDVGQGPSRQILGAAGPHRVGARPQEQGRLIRNREVAATPRLFLLLFLYFYMSLLF